MSYKISLKMTDAATAGEFENPMGRTILESVLAAGADYPHGCRAGNCGACKSHLISGEVEMSPYSEFALSNEEKARGLILACRAVPWSDCEIEPIAVEDAAVHASRRLECRVAEIEAATHDIRIVRLDILSGGPFDYTAGQYAELTFDGLPPRDFSMAAAPGADHLEFHVRRVAGGTVTTHVLENLSVGDPVRVSGPMGTAHYRAGHKGPMLLLAGGSGLAPIKAIIEAALAGGQDLFVYFGARDERDIYLESHFQDLAARHGNLKFTVVLSEPDGPTMRRTGFLADAVAADFTGLDGFKAYLAGPPVMVESATEALTGLGLARRDCHADAFYTEPEKSNP
ncbi:MAG: 2Fe-2S iron-sulfur cluster binding domain-containing protein [Rhodospirillaceae bacterium]|nr:2Fe-2S iron-sulfur cluster binding domain-containing protein [Rhodospirillaceae bacterium]MBT4115567.1 2Fe-2S iron-sulfur cluster binding domain-containing protein [Rhodospirillaceae bacterium]MBT4674543.1 2Fe-2S iron-sulfur cluster binding domain-containing protein [Rhodospirillaceae bacterium]